MYEIDRRGGKGGSKNRSLGQTQNIEPQPPFRFKIVVKLMKVKIIDLIKTLLKHCIMRHKMTKKGTIYNNR